MSPTLDFDPEAFMTQTIDQPLHAERTLVPEGEFRMRIADFTSEAIESFAFTYKRGPAAGEEGKLIKFNCPILVDDDKVRKLLETDNPRVFHTCTLDFNEDGTLAFGPNKNIDLGKLRHATGQNADGPWNLMMLKGSKPFMGKTQHREGKRKDGTPFKVCEIVRFAPIR